MNGRESSESVASLLERLRFVSSSAPAVYLNERLANEMFTAQLGAIGSFTRAAGTAMEGQAGPSIVRVGASRDTSEQVNYELDNPLTKALLLHSALGGAQALGRQPNAPPGTFIEVLGSVDLPPVAFADPAPELDLRTTIEEERERQEQMVRAFGDTDTVFMSLLIMDRRGTVGAVINRRWIRYDWAAAYLPQQQVAFGIAERVVDGLALLTLIYMRPFI